MIEVEDLWKAYGRFVALQGVSFSAPRGSITGFLGPNGAGKSTCMKILTTYLPFASGRVTIDGVDVRKQPAEVCRRVGYMPEQIALYPEMRVREYLRFRARMRRLDSKAVRTRVDAVMEECALVDVQRKLLGALSKGYRQRVGLADVLLHEPQVLILDEPTSGLDPLQVVEVRRLIERLRGDRTILLSSHILGEVENVCDQVVIINGGRIRACESRQSWQERLRRVASIELQLTKPNTDVSSVLSEQSWVTSVAGSQIGSSEAPVWRYELVTDGDRRRDVYRLAVAKEWDLVELRSFEASLEDLFLEVTSDSGEEDAA